MHSHHVKTNNDFFSQNMDTGEDLNYATVNIQRKASEESRSLMLFMLPPDRKQLELMLLWSLCMHCRGWNNQSCQILHFSIKSPSAFPMQSFFFFLVYYVETNML